MKCSRRFVALVAVAMVVGMASDANAQLAEKSYFVELTGGLAIPIGDFGDNVKTEAVAVGARFAWSFSPRWWLSANLGTTFFNGKEQGTDLKAYAYSLAATYELPTTAGGEVTVPVFLGLGAVTFDSDVEGASANTYFAVNGGAKFQWYINQGLALNLTGAVTLAFADQEEVGDDIVVTFPILVGVVLLF
jgi:hypothetical protein